MDRLEQLLTELRRFEHERDWAQYHSPKNLVMSLTSEVGELVEHFRWLTEEQSDRLAPEVMEQVRHEVGDVVICLLQVCERLGLDPVTAAEEKLKLVEQKYPAHKVRGQALKYSDYPDEPQAGGDE
jgi:NTP pyrophosphatase (non-canonical NTP hydrolase)